MTVEGALFETPALWALVDRQGHGSSHPFDQNAFSFDDVTAIDKRSLESTQFLPLVKSAEASTAANLTICGIILKRVPSHQNPSLFERVGFAIVDEENGGIANTGWFLKRWKPPPWECLCLNVIHII